MGNKIYRVVLTGGPCGGKTTSLAHLTEQLEKHGYRVFRVPEAATLLFTGGVSRPDIGLDEIGFQTNLMKLQMFLEDTYSAQAKACGEPSVVLIDRGVMDALGFMDHSKWQALLDHNDWTEVGLRDKRYDAVIHLVTAAEGAEEFYTCENNEARGELSEEARIVDHKLREAWLGHSHYRIIDNSTDFECKIERVTEALCRVIGIPTPTEIERKFLVTSIPADADWPIPFKDVEIEQTYLLSPDGDSMRVRKRGNQGSFTYTHTIKKPVRKGQRVEIERNISSREYVNLLLQKDPARETIHKVRRTFLWKNHYFELDTFADTSDLLPSQVCGLLEVELLKIDDHVEMPDFLEIERDVTGDGVYSNSELAKKLKKVAVGVA